MVPIPKCSSADNWGNYFHLIPWCWSILSMSGTPPTMMSPLLVEHWCHSNIYLFHIALLINGPPTAQWEFGRPVLKNLKLKLEVRWVLQNWGKTEAFRCFLRKWKSVKNWLRYKQFSDFPNSKIFAGMLKKLAAQLSHCAAPCTRRDMRFSVFTNNI